MDEVQNPRYPDEIYKHKKLWSEKTFGKRSLEIRKDNATTDIKQI
jgi:hypothetical protein